MTDSRAASRAGWLGCDPVSMMVCNNKAMTKKILAYHKIKIPGFHIFHKGKWISVENMMMDKCIVVKGNRAFCVPVRDIKKGVQIIVGEKGIKITPPERPREGVNVFEFMALNLPDSIAVSAFRCELKANSSCISLVIFAFLRVSSAATPI